MPEKGLKTVLRNLKGRLTGEAPERARVWQEKVHPWLGEYWPQAAVRNTAGTSDAILELLAECGEAFAQAAEWSLEHLRPHEGRGLYRLNENGHAERYRSSSGGVLPSSTVEVRRRFSHQTLRSSRR